MNSGMAENKKRMIIIGSSGMLGQELAKVFQNYQLRLYDLNDLDITNEQEVIKKITDEKPDLVINAAAYNDVDGAEKNRALANKVNGLAVGYLARAINSIGGLLVHYSTDYVFPGDKKAGYYENDVPNPISIYGHSKLEGEKKLSKLCNKYYLIRLSRLFGKSGISPLAKKSFVEQMLELSKNKKELNVINEELSCLTYAPDLAKQTKLIIDENKPFGIYHVTNTGSGTWYEFAKEIFNINKIKIKLNPVNGDFFSRIAKRPKYSILINTKLLPLRKWQSALREHLTKD